jgi:alkylated DNA repair dioxygenase AlkB
MSLPLGLPRMSRRSVSGRLFVEPIELPPGFAHQPEFLSEEEETDLLEQFKTLEFHPFNFRGYVAKRRIMEYGFEYDFTSRQASATEAIPAFLADLREKASKWAGVATEEIVKAVIAEYPPGAPIGWHRDVPQFDMIIGISLGSSCTMRFKPYKKTGRIISITLERRSAYIMRGEVRWNYQHSIAPVKELRYSITFRTSNRRRDYRTPANGLAFP